MFLATDLNQQKWLKKKVKNEGRMFGEQSRMVASVVSLKLAITWKLSKLKKMEPLDRRTQQTNKSR